MFSKIAVIGALITFFNPVQALWPQPRSITTGTSALKLVDSFSINLFKGAPDDLKQAVARAQVQLKNDKLERLVVGRGSVDASAVAQAPSLKKLSVSLLNGATAKSIAEEAVADIETRVESYTLTVPSDGSDATLQANSTLGLFRGLSTFTQLFYFNDNTVYTISAPVKIEDSPAYKYRGLMLDTARNYYPLTDIKRTLDAMSWVKINTFHWHIVDSQSFPLSLDEFPELSDKGAYSSSQKYTVQNVKDVVSYAAARGIDVILEIDTPGHTSVIGNAHPEYIACQEATPWTSYCNEPPCGQLRLTQSAVIDFTSKLFSAVLAHLPGQFFSTGGDEINARCYAEDPVTQADLTASGQTIEQALDVFTQKTHAAITAKGKTPVVWQEMVIDHPVTLANGTVVMVWISSADAKTVASKGYRIVHSPSDYFYLDCGGGGWVGKNVLGNSWCDPFKTWQKAYSFDPLANLTPDESKLVLGGQQLLWSEQSDPSNLDSIVWPRAASSAEVFWTGTAPGGGPLNGTEALPRLHDVRYRMVQRGIKAIALQPLWCALRPNACDL